MRFVLTSALFASFVCACASAPPPKPAAEPQAAAEAPPAPSNPAVEMEKTPFTAEQIREAWPTGRKFTMKVEATDKPVSWRTTEFVKTDEKGAEIKSTVADEKGATVESKTSQITWEELRSHAEFPKSHVEVKYRTISVPMGTLPCVVYKVTEGAGDSEEVTTFYFAEKMPGPPVFFFTDRAGKRILTTTMEPK